jgi:hypothetical protein
MLKHSTHTTPPNEISQSYLQEPKKALSGVVLS